MTTEEKKAYLLLKAIIFGYHGLDEQEKDILITFAQDNNAEDELKWAFGFIESDVLTAFDRARDYLNVVMNAMEKQKRLDYLGQVWKANNQKGYITEMEATAMIKLAKDWKIERDLITLVRS